MTSQTHVNDCAYASARADASGSALAGENGIRFDGQECHALSEPPLPSSWT